MKRMNESVIGMINDFSKTVERMHAIHGCYASNRDITFTVNHRGDSQGECFLKLNNTTINIRIDPTLAKKIRELAVKAVEVALEGEKTKFRLHKSKIIEDLDEVEKGIDSL